MAGGKASGPDLGLLILRIALGAIFIAHGIDKLLVDEPLKSLADGLANLGIPYADKAALAVISAEIGGGLLLVLGLYARVGALAVAAIMVVAIMKVHWHNGFWLPKVTAEPMEAGTRIPMGYEYCAALLAMALCVLLTGPGKMSLLLGKKGKPGGK